MVKGEVSTLIIAAVIVVLGTYLWLFLASIIPEKIEIPGVSHYKEKGYEVFVSSFPLDTELLSTNGYDSVIKLENGKLKEFSFQSGTYLEYEGNPIIKVSEPVDILLKFISENEIIFYISGVGQVTIRLYGLNPNFTYTVKKDGKVFTGWKLIGSTMVINTELSQHKFEIYGTNESILRNRGNNSIPVYLLMKVQWYNPSTGKWEDEAIVYQSPSPINLSANETVKLDQYFNGKWNTNQASHGPGLYRVWVAALDEEGNIMANKDGSQVFSVYNFTISGLTDRIILRNLGAITKIEVKLKQMVHNPNLIGEVKKTVPVPKPREIVYQYFNITKVNFNNSMIKNATIEFRVNNSWINENGIKEVYLAKYENGWEKLDTELINKTEKYSYYKVSVDSFSYFAILGEVCEEGEKRCNGDNLEQCINNSWQVIEVCEYGCDPSTLSCKPKPSGGGGGGAGGGGGGYVPPATSKIVETLNLSIYRIEILLKEPKTGPSIEISEISTLPEEIPEPKQTYKLFQANKTNFDNEDVENITLEFKVPKSWIVENNISEVYLYGYENGWSKLDTEITNETPDYNYYTSYSTFLPSYLAIAGMKEEQVCVEGEKRCSDNELQICENNSWKTLEVCTYGCNFTLLACNPEPLVVERICEEGAKRCNNNNLEQCINNSWQVIEVCEYGCNETTLSCNPRPGMPATIWLILGLAIATGVGALLYLKRYQIKNIIASLRSSSLDRRIMKIEAKIAKLKAQGRDTTEIEGELELIKKDLEIGLEEIAKSRLDALEKKLESL